MIDRKYKIGYCQSANSDVGAAYFNKIVTVTPYKGINVALNGGKMSLPVRAGNFIPTEEFATSCRPFFANEERQEINVGGQHGYQISCAAGVPIRHCLHRQQSNPYKHAETVKRFQNEAQAHYADDPQACEALPGRVYPIKLSRRAARPAGAFALLRANDAGFQPVYSRRVI